jgi:hypothetical protein
MILPFGGRDPGSNPGGTIKNFEYLRSLYSFNMVEEKLIGKVFSFFDKICIIKRFIN